MENQNVETNPNTVVIDASVIFMKNILHNYVYDNYNNVMELATEIVKRCDYLNMSTYNPAARTIEFKIKKSAKKNKQLPCDYYIDIARVLQHMIINVWNNIITTAIHKNSNGVSSFEYGKNITLYTCICSTDASFFMLLFNITAMTSNSILLHL